MRERSEGKAVRPSEGLDKENKEERKWCCLGQI